MYPLLCVDHCGPLYLSLRIRPYLGVLFPYCAMRCRNQSLFWAYTVITWLNIYIFIWLKLYAIFVAKFLFLLRIIISTWYQHSLLSIRGTLKCVFSNNNNIHSSTPYRSLFIFLFFFICFSFCHITNTCYIFLLFFLLFLFLAKFIHLLSFMTCVTHPFNVVSCIVCSFVYLFVSLKISNFRYLVLLHILRWRLLIA